jgi:hypothetical protein
MKKRASRRRVRRSYRRNPSRTVADPHGARELALTYDNERAVQNQKESIINNLARKMAKGQYDKAKAVKLWSYAAKAGADHYARTMGSHGDTGSSLFNAATRMKAAEILESENRDYVKERSESFAPKAKAKHKRNPSPRRRTRRNPAPSESRRFGRLGGMRDKLLEKYHAAKTDKAKHEALMRVYKLDGISRRAGDRYRSKRTPTISEIESATRDTAPYYFVPKTLKAFGQRMSDFKVMKSKKSGRIFIAAASRTHKGMYSIKEFVGGNRLRSVSDAPKHFVDVRDWVNRQ